MNTTSSLGDDRLRLWLSRTTAVRMLRDLGIDAVDVEPTYRRLREDGSAMIALRIHAMIGVERVTQEGYVRIFGSAARQAEVEQKWRRLRVRDTRLGAGIRKLPDDTGSLLLFPNDLQLRRLHLLHDVDKLKRLLTALPWFSARGWRVKGSTSTITAVRYKPEHRYVARASLGIRHESTGAARPVDVFLRYFTDRRGARTMRTLEHLRDRLSIDWIPEAVGSFLDGCAYAERALEGSPLLASDIEITPSIDSAAAAAALGSRLASLHRADTRSLKLPARPDLVTRGREAVGALCQAGVLTQAEAADLRRLVDAIRLQNVHRSVLHGDLHLHQVIVGPTGPALVDFERCAIGDPLDDVGNLMSHCESLPAEQSDWSGFASRFLESYLRHGPVRPAGERNAYLAIAHLERAILPVRRMQPDAHGQAHRLIDRALQILDPAPARPSTAEASPDTARPPLVDRLAQSPLEWRSVFPRSRGAWPAILEDATGQRVFASFDPDRGSLRIETPTGDPLLAPCGADLHRGELLGYRVGRRAIIRIDGADSHSTWVKIVAPKKAERLLSRYRALADAVSGRESFAIPELIEVHLQRGRFVFADLPGISLHARLADVERQPGTCLDTVAAAIVDLQRMTPALSTVIAHDAAVRDANKWIAWREMFQGGPISAYRSALQAVEDAARRSGADGAPSVCRHGDLHDKNIILQESGRVGFLDLDGISLGDAAEDPGNLAAHLVLRSMQQTDSSRRGWIEVDAFLRHYADAGGGATTRRILALAAAATLRLACVYQFRRRWTAMAPRLLEDSLRFAEASERCD